MIELMPLRIDEEHRDSSKDKPDSMHEDDVI